MNVLIPVLVMLCSFTSATLAETNREESVHLIIAADQSQSMNGSATPSWADVQRTVLREYFEQYSVRCQILHVDYIGWGQTVQPSVHAVLTSAGAAKSFAEVMNRTSHNGLGGTSHILGIMAAANLVTEDFDRVVMIFTTDEGAGFATRTDLKNLIPPNVEFIGISLGTEHASRYLEQSVVPENGLHYHANSPTELKAVLTNTLDTLGFDRCMAS